MKDLTGMVFNRLTAIRPNGKSKKGNYKWDCICLCGKEITVGSTNLISGNTNSCGCYREDRLLEYSTTHGYSGGQHNNARAEYTAWMNMKSRCLNSKDKGYINYGGRGVKICERWLESFENFIKDMGDKPTPSHSIERNDVDGDYEPSNCYWTTIDVQAKNKRNTHWIEHDGIRLNLTDWANKIGAYEENLRRMMKKKSFSDCVNYYLFNKRKRTCKKRFTI